MNTQCHRCLKFTDGVHNCVPTEGWAKLEAEIADLTAAISANPVQADEETHRRVDAAVMAGRINDCRQVAQHEIVAALRGPIGAVGNARRKELADRIESHGIAPPDCQWEADAAELQVAIEKGEPK